MIILFSRCAKIKHKKKKKTRVGTFRRHYETFGIYYTAIQDANLILINRSHAKSFVFQKKL